MKSTEEEQTELRSNAEAEATLQRNREAVAALNRGADEALRAAKDDVEARRDIARALQDLSAHFRKYAPVVEAAK